MVPVLSNRGNEVSPLRLMQAARGLAQVTKELALPLRLPVAGSTPHPVLLEPQIWLRGVEPGEGVNKIG